MSEQRHIQEGYQAKVMTKEGKGYQPQAGGTLDPRTLKPPKGDTAIQPPKSAGGDKAS